MDVTEHRVEWERSVSLKGGSYYWNYLELLAHGKKKKKSRLTFSKFYYSFKILHLKCTLLACTGQLTPTTPPLAVLLTSPSWVSDSQASALALFLAAFQRDFSPHIEHLEKPWHLFLCKEKEGDFGVGNGNSLQYSCLENPMDRGAWWATVHGVTKSRTQLSN